MHLWLIVNKYFIIIYNMHSTHTKLLLINTYVILYVISDYWMECGDKIGI